MRKSSTHLRAGFFGGVLILLMCLLTSAMLHAQLKRPDQTQKKQLGLIEVRGLKKQAEAQTDDPSVIYLNAKHIDAMSQASQNARKSVASFSGKQMHMFKFSGPIQPEWYKMITDAGAEVVDYVPNYTYVVFGDYPSLVSLQGEASKSGSPIVWDGDFLPEYRISPSVYETDASGNPNTNRVITQRFQIQLYNNEAANTVTKQLMERIKVIGTPVYEQSISRYVNIIVSLTPDGLKTISERPDVISVYPWVEPTRNDEAQDMIMTGQLSGNSPVPGNYLTWLAGKGFTEAQFNTSGFAVNITDGGLDNGQASVGGPANPTFHFALFRNGDNTLASRVLFIHAQGTATLTDTKGCEGHGNINTHIVGGYIPDALLGNSNHTDANGFRYGLGVAPFVKLGNSTIFNAGGSYTNPVLNNVEAESYRDGARISTNSWGASVAGAYNASAQNYDFLVRDAQPASSSVPAAGNQEMVIFFSAGNSGSGAGTIGSPGTGKNVITVGATENVRAFGGSDGCGITDAQANSANDIIFFSSRGPCTDGRTKPDIVAPGTHVTGGVYPSSASNPQSGSGTANACFTAGGVCGGSGSNFFPSSQQWTTASSGTSHSTPATAGFGALIRQDFINRTLTPASPAMTKAMVLTSASWMNGTGAGDNLFSNNQGMGRVNMNNYFDVMTNPNLIRDQVAGDMFTASGQTRTFTGTVASSGQPLRVTLAWTDAPGPTSGNAYVNNLDLEVTVNGTLYRGNVFSGAFSTTGGAADIRNNVESVILPAGTTGSVSIVVRATNIAGDGVPNVGGALDQDFALVAGNFTQAAVPVVAPAGATLVTESCLPANGVIDPGETVTVSFCLQNTGTANTGASVVGTLLATGGVITPSGPQNFGTLTAGGAAVCRNFTFTNNSSICGSTITASIQVQDGANNLGTVTYVFTLGTTATLISENFDGVAAPNLPAGWTAVNAAGAAPLWVTSNSGTPAPPAASAPNAAFVNDPGATSDKQLITPSFTPASGAKLTFSHNYSFESPNFDGGVLEISINGGAYTDILTAGGSFVSGGYTGTISTCCTTPINGRAAWIGSSGGAFVPVTVNLPASSAGQPTRLRFRMGSDEIFAGVGWRIDDFQITQPACCGATCTITCPANITVNSSAGACGANVTLPPATTTGLCGPVTYSPASGSFFPVGTTTVTATTASGPSCTFTVTVVDATAPTITCPSNITVNNNPGICGAVVNYPYPSVTDNCALPGGTAVPLTQSTNNSTIVPIQIGCQYFGGQTAENSWWRAYDLAPLNLPTSGLTIASVRIGVERITTASTVPVTVRIYTSAGAFPGGTRTLRATQLVNLSSQTGTFVVIPFSTPATVPSNSIVVVEVNVPDLLAANSAFFLGSNDLGQSAPSYISAAACGITTPTDIGDVGFPDDHILLDLNGVYYTTAPTLVQIAGLARGATFPVGTTVNTYRATDAAGNQSTCSFNVTVVDVEQPVFTTCPSPVVRNTDAGVCYATYTPAQPVFTDNCAVTKLTWVMTGATTGSSPATGINYVPSTQFQLTGTTGQGVTTILYTATDAAGNSRTCTTTVTVNDASIPVITVQPLTKFVCVGSDAVFSVTASAGTGNPLTYQWQQWNGSAWVNISGATASSYTIPAVTFALNTNTYRVVLTGRCSVVISAVATLYINPLPTVKVSTSIPPSLIPSQSLTITATVSPTGGTFVWRKDGNVIAGATGSSLSGLTVDDIGTYRVTYTDPNGCVSTSADVVVTGQATDKLWVYPNPNYGQFQVRFYNTPGENATVRVYDAKGAKVFEKAVVTGLAYTQIDVDLGPVIPAGMYVVELRNSAGKQVGAKKIDVRHRP